MSRWHEANHPRGIFDWLHLSRRLKLNPMRTALPLLHLSTACPTISHRYGRDVARSQKVKPRLFNRRDWALLCEVLQRSVTHAAWESCHVLHGNGFDDFSLSNETGYDAAHCIRFCGSLWEQKEEKQSKVRSHKKPSHPNQHEVLSYNHSVEKKGVLPGSVAPL